MMHLRVQQTAVPGTQVLFCTAGIIRYTSTSCCMGHHVYSHNTCLPGCCRSLQHRHSRSRGSSRTVGAVKSAALERIIRIRSYFLLDVPFCYLPLVLLAVDLLTRETYQVRVITWGMYVCMSSFFPLYKSSVMMPLVHHQCLVHAECTSYSYVLYDAAALTT